MTGCRIAIGRTALNRLRRFSAAEEGVATIDWVLICCGATAAGAVALNMGKDTFTQYSSNMRSEVQGSYFQAPWADQLAIPQPELWGEQAAIMPNAERPDTETPWGGNETLTVVANGGPLDPPPTEGGCDPETTPDCTGDGGTPTEEPTGGGDAGGDMGGDTGGGTPPEPPPLFPVRADMPMLNAGFEEAQLMNGLWTMGIPQWTASYVGEGLVGDFNPMWWSIDKSTVTGQNVGVLYHDGGTNSTALSQTLDAVYDAGATYEFSVDIGDGSYSYSLDQPYVLNIYAGSTVIGTTSGSTGDINRLETVTVTATVSDPALNGAPIRFEIVNPPGPGGDLIVDNIRGTVTTLEEAIVPTVMNGDFASNTGTGWHLNSGTGQIVIYAQALGFNAWDRPAGGVASQVVTVTPGADYVLTADVFEFGSGVASHALQATVLSATGATLAQTTVTVEDGQLLPLELPFVSTTEQVTLQFTNPWSSWTAATDVMLDNVAVSRP